MNYAPILHNRLQICNLKSHSTSNTSVKFSFTSGTIYISGRYNKFDRRLSQTPWELNGVRLYETSLEEEIFGPLEEKFQPVRHKFHSGGREDIDVRMLGKGRPFVIELISPKIRYGICPEVLKELQNKINDHLYLTKASIPDIKIQVQNLQLSNSDCFKFLSESAKVKVKAYSSVVRFDKPVSDEQIKFLESLQDIIVKQKTPIRVLHRRTLMVRDKIIHKLKINRLSENWFVVFILGSAGTYIKEFVHGDLGRTLPNIGSLVGNKADIFQLDVLDLYDSFSEKTLSDFIDSAVKHSFEFK
jgi:tRNA pseudouridine synthase 10